jgi:DDE superfamily endonuclease
VSHEIYSAYVKLPPRDSRPPDSLLNDEDLYPYFKDCIGAIDGTHIPAFVPEANRAPYRNRKGHISQNVLAACSLDFKFVYVLSGWEGSASDSVVYQNAKDTDFKIPDRKYYLADAGYPNTDSLLAPYRGVRYHLKEWGGRDNRCDHLMFCYLCINVCRPRNKEELFNLRHARLRNVIERIFGVLKKRFKVLLVAQEYSFVTQTQLISAVAFLHNFIISNDPDEISIDDIETEGSWDDTWSRHQTAVPRDERARAAQRRDRIAEEMWANYTTRPARRRR